MRRFWLFFIASLFYNVLLSQTVREYFFDDLESSDTLVIFCNEPQTEIAQQLHNRIYFDSVFIKKIKSEFYEEYEDNEKLIHFCGFDLFFYKLSNGQLKFVNKLNSTCGLSQFACKEAGLSMLLESGKYLNVDTLKETPKSKKTFIDLFCQNNVLKWKYSGKTDWDICKTAKFPLIYYDGYFTTKIVLDTSYSLAQNMDNFLLNFVSNTTNTNWNFSSQWGQNEGNSTKLKRFERLKEIVEIDVTFYVNKKDFNAFKKMKIKSINYTIDPRFPLLIFYKD